MRFIGKQNCVLNFYKNPSNIDSGLANITLADNLITIRDQIDTLDTQVIDLDTRVDTLDAQMVIVDNDIDTMGDQIEALENNFPVVSVVASKTLALSDRNTLQVVNNGSTVTITVPPDPTVVFPTNGGTIINFTQDGAGQITFAAGVGVTIKSYLNKLSTAGQDAGCTLVYTSLNTWRLYGTLI